MLSESGDNQFNLLKCYTLEIKWTVDISIDIHIFLLLQNIWRFQQNFVGILKQERKMVLTYLKN